MSSAFMVSRLNKASTPRPMAAFSMAARLAFLVFGPMMDIKLLFMYSGVFKRKVVLGFLIGLFVLIGALAVPWINLIQGLAR